MKQYMLRTKINGVYHYYVKHIDIPKGMLTVTWSRYLGDAKLFGSSQEIDTLKAAEPVIKGRAVIYKED